MLLSRFSFFSGKLKPNLGRFNDPPDWTEILTYFRGSELQNYFTKVLEDDLKAFIKVQYVDQIPKAVKGTVQALLDKKDEQNIQDKICDILDLNRVSLFLMLFYVKLVQYLHLFHIIIPAIKVIKWGRLKKIVSKDYYSIKD